MLYVGLFIIGFLNELAYTGYNIACARGQRGRAVILCFLLELVRLPVALLVLVNVPPFSAEQFLRCAILTAAYMLGTAVVVRP